MNKNVLCLLLLFLNLGQAFAEEKIIPENYTQLWYSFSPLVKKTAPSVANIYTSKKVTVRNSIFDNDPFFRDFFSNPLRQGEQKSLGSGVIVDPSGIVVTSNHVISGADEIKVVLYDHKEYEAKILASDARTDLALLQIKSKNSTFPYLHIGDSNSVEVGDLVIAIGNPFGVGQTVTHGIVSAIARSTLGISEYDYFIQTDAAINPGNSGGALVDMKGKLIGINTLIFSKTGGSNGIGFAIPSKLVQTMLLSWKKEGKIIRPWLGFKVQSVDDKIAKALGLNEAKGVIIKQMFETSHAFNQGLRIGDVILSIDKKEILNENALKFYIATKQIGSVATFEVFRKDEGTLKYECKLEAPLDYPSRDPINISGDNPLEGIQAVNINPAVVEEMGLVDSSISGVVVYKVESDSASSQYGFTEGDVLLEINNKKVTSTKNLKVLLSQINHNYEIHINRSGNLITMRIIH